MNGYRWFACWLAMIAALFLPPCVNWNAWLLISVAIAPLSISFLSGIFLSEDPEKKIACMILAFFYSSILAIAIWQVVVTY